MERLPTKNRSKSLPQGTSADPARLRTLLLVVGAAGYLARIALWWTTEGSNDIRTWLFFAASVARDGLETTYIEQPLFNHPPLMGAGSVVLLHLSSGKLLTFAQVFKLPSLIAELVTGYLLFAAWRAKGEPMKGYAAFAAYGLALCCILISGYHGNTDALYFCLAFAAAYLMEARRAPFWSGVALGAAINVKLIPVLLGLPLAARCETKKERLHYLAGCSIGALPFLWVFLGFGSEGRKHFVQNLFQYRSNLEYWGVELFVRWGQRLLDGHEFGDAIRGFGDGYSVHGGKLLLLASLGLAGWQVVATHRSRRRLFDAYELSALALALFLLLGSGFGVQYVGCVVAPLLACRLAGGALYATASGIFIGVVYVTFVIEWSPVYSLHRPMSASFTGLSLLAWSSLLVVVFALIRDRVRRSAPKPDQA